MVILGIETSCDETAAAVLQKKGDKIEILSNVISSSAKLQEKYGGIIPEQAAREQLKVIIPVIEQALIDAFPSSSLKSQVSSLDALAVTYGPGLIGSLLVGVETAKVLSFIWNKPLIPVNHLTGHFYANWTEHDPQFPLIGLLASGGHTDLVLFKGHGDYQYLGGTRDDAAGECFDKCARLLGLPYPGGPEISKLAEKGNPKAFNLPRPMLSSNDFDFSYSGLKTAVANLVMGNGLGVMGKNKKTHHSSLITHHLSDLCASIEQAIIDPLIKKALKAAQQFKVKTIILGGGVAANDKLRSELQLNARRYLLDAEIFAPQKFLCTDNASMIASAAFFTKDVSDSLTLQANPNLSL